ncbi:MAG: DUF998 domain-containing protein [Candidatus Thorarchaeota archaeon]
MNLVSEKTAGLFIFFGTVQFVFMSMILAMVEPGYSISANFVSELALGTNGLIFDMIMIIQGGFVAIGAIILYRVAAQEPFFPSKLFSILLCVGGLGILGAGAVPMATSHLFGGFPMHVFLTTVGIFSAVGAIFVGYKLVNPPFSYIHIIMGVLGVLTTVLVLTATDLGIGPGGMERMNAYSLILWLLPFSGVLMSKPQSN